MLRNRFLDKKRDQVSVWLDHHSQAFLEVHLCPMVLARPVCPVRRIIVMLYCYYLTNQDCPDVGISVEFVMSEGEHHAHTGSPCSPGLPSFPGLPIMPFNNNVQREKTKALQTYYMYVSLNTGQKMLN